jgi:hypothetical protein
MISLVIAEHLSGHLCEQCGEVARRDDPGCLVTGERRQAALVAGNEIIWPASARASRKSSARIGGAFHMRKLARVLCEFP